MPWVRFDDNTPDNPKIDALSDQAFRLWFNSICYANRNLTDGFVPTARVPRLTSNYKHAYMAELIEAGRWHKEHDGIRIHDYLNSQFSAAQIAEQREREREKKARQRAAGGRKTASTGIRDEKGRFTVASPGDNTGEDPRGSQRDDTGDSRRVSSSSQPNPSNTTPVSCSNSRLLGDEFSETSNSKATATAQRIATLLTSTNAGKPPAPTDIISLVQWATSSLDLTSLDEAVGYLETLNDKPRTVAYVARAVRTWAGDRGVDLPEWSNT